MSYERPKEYGDDIIIIESAIDEPDPLPSIIIKLEKPMTISEKEYEVALDWGTRRQPSPLGG